MHLVLWYGMLQQNRVWRSSLQNTIAYYGIPFILYHDN